MMSADLNQKQLSYSVGSAKSREKPSNKKRKKALKEFLISWTEVEGSKVGPKQVEILLQHYKENRHLMQDGEWIDKEGFKKFFGIKNTMYLDRLWEMFGETRAFVVHDAGGKQQQQQQANINNNNNPPQMKDVINLRQFLCNLSLIAGDEDVEQKYKFAFSLFDIHGSGYITKSDLREMLKASLVENELSLDMDKLNDVVDFLFEDIDKNADGKIDFNEFKAFFLESNRKSFTLGHLAFHSKKQQQSTTAFDQQQQEQEAEPPVLPYIVDEDEDEDDDDATEDGSYFKSPNPADDILSGIPMTSDFTFETPIDLIKNRLSRAFTTARRKSTTMATQGGEKQGQQQQQQELKRTHTTATITTTTTTITTTTTTATATMPAVVEFTSETENYFPSAATNQVVPFTTAMRNLKKSIDAYIALEGTKVVFMALYVITNIALFIAFFMKYKLNEDKAKVLEILGYGLPVAKGFANVIKFNGMIILLPVCRNLLTIVRNTKLNDYLPIDKNIIFHKRVAYMLAIASLGHTFAHYHNAYRISKTPSDVLHDALGPVFNGTPSFWHVAFKTLPGLTGHLMLIIMLIMYVCASTRVRQRSFEVFWYSHHLFIPFFFLFLAHGAAAILEIPNFWALFIAPSFIYMVERMIRLYRSKHKVLILSAKHMPAKTVSIVMKRPQKFYYKAGQYVFLNCPYISPQEWHPFTLTSTPEENVLSVHIKAAGNWTRTLYRLCGEDVLPSPRMLPLYVDGPYGAAAEHVFDYKYVILIGAGIGVTPYAAVLKHIKYQLEHDRFHQLKLRKCHFYWICREQLAFKWFADMLRELEEEQQQQQQGCDDDDQGEEEEEETSEEEEEEDQEAKNNNNNNNNSNNNKSNHKKKKRVKADRSRNFLQIQTYITSAGTRKINDLRTLFLWLGLEKQYTRQQHDAITGLRSRTYWGRPDFDKIFAEMRAKYAGEDIGVFFCGSRILSKSLYSLCRKYNAMPDDIAPVGGGSGGGSGSGSGGGSLKKKPTRFWYHKENF